MAYDYQKFTSRTSGKGLLPLPGKRPPSEKRFVGKTRGEQVGRLSALKQPNVFYSKEMVMDPWKSLNLVVGRILVPLPSAMEPPQKRSGGKDFECPRYPNKRWCSESPPESASSLVANRPETYAGFTFSTSPSPAELPFPSPSLLSPSPALLPLPSVRLMFPSSSLLPMAPNRPLKTDEP